ncbi:MAG: M15 family metallopeptidase [Micrococcales bacterium]|nr:M15 family metallopeptidase [Micrococcales bacterium]
MSVRRGRSPRGALLALVVALSTPLGAAWATPAEAATADTATAGSTTAADPAPPTERAPLTPEQVKAQVAQAATLKRQLTAANKEVAAASAELTQLAARSSAAMDSVATAKAAQGAARQRERTQLARLKQLTAQAAAARRDLSNMAYDAYVNGSGSLRDVAAVVGLAEDDEGTRQAPLVDYLATARAADGKHYTSLAQAQRETAAAAIAARREREAATAKAQAAAKTVQETVAQQQQALTALQVVAKSKSAELSKLGVDAGGLGLGVDQLALSSITTTPLCTQAAGDYPNGMFPGTALCPVAGRPGHMMRPAAARALNALAAAYEKDLGSPLCITDTYRSYAAQVDVKARKPVLAAKPGTSNHGLGLATDLCGGIENFGTTQHQWMRSHAPLFGFYHPAWAQPGGSKPEPWHWEFSQ